MFTDVTTRIASSRCASDTSMTAVSLLNMKSSRMLDLLLCGFVKVSAPRLRKWEGVGIAQTGLVVRVLNKDNYIRTWYSLVAPARMKLNANARNFSRTNVTYYALRLTGRMSTQRTIIAMQPDASYVIISCRRLRRRLLPSLLQMVARSE